MVLRSPLPAPSTVSPGFAGLRRPAGSGSFIGRSPRGRRRREDGRTRRIDDVPDPAGVLARVASAHRLERVGHAEARAELHLAAADPGLEAVERPDRRAADLLALEVVDAAVAGADEVARRGHELDRAADVRAPRGERDERSLRLVEGRARDG